VWGRCETEEFIDQLMFDFSKSYHTTWRKIHCVMKCYECVELYLHAHCICFLFLFGIVLYFLLGKSAVKRDFGLAEGVL
jgi:hypothetical protein